MKKGLLKMKKIEEKILSIFKSKTCNRKDYWCFFGILILFIMVLILFGYLFNKFYVYGFNQFRYWTFLEYLYLTLNIIMQIKRLRDANITPHILWIHLLRLFNFRILTFLLDLLLMILLLLPTQRQATIKKENSIKEAQ